MLVYELYNPLLNKSLGFFNTEAECHLEAKDLLEYEIVTCHYSLKELRRIVTHTYKQN
jgi:hypothetical protein